MSRHPNFAVAALCLIATACASAPSGVDTAGASRSRNFIPKEEISGAISGTAFDAVRVLRPIWLVKRGPQSISNEADIWVYVGRARLGGVESLRQIAAQDVAWMEFLDPAAATYRFGSGHPNGAIIVSVTDRPPAR